jgi:predicted ABC-class ATPase
MSSVYLSPADLSLIKKIVTECCLLEPNRDFEKEVTVADHIADWMQNGIHDEEELRRRLEALGMHMTMKPGQ